MRRKLSLSLEVSGAGISRRTACFFHVGKKQAKRVRLSLAPIVQLVDNNALFAVHSVSLGRMSRSRSVQYKTDSFSSRIDL